MAILDHKITENEKNARNVKVQPDLLSGTPNENKDVFDTLPEFIAERYNDALDDIDSSFTGQAESVEAIRANLQDQIDQLSETVNPLTPRGLYPTIEDLRSAHPTGDIGDSWLVGDSQHNTTYLWDADQSDWVDIGGLIDSDGFRTAFNKNFETTTSNIKKDGTASVGSADTIPRADHVHPTDTSRASQADLTALTTVVNGLLQRVYPVGAIYMSTSSTSPATLFGFGTWTRISGRFLIGVNSTYTVGSTGGSATVSYKPAGTVGAHKLTISEIPAHIHQTHYYGSGGSTSYQGWQFGDRSYLGEATEAGSLMKSVGGNGSHSHSFTGTTATLSNLPPYEAVYIWKRTA